MTVVQILFKFSPFRSIRRRQETYVEPNSHTRTSLLASLPCER